MTELSTNTEENREVRRLDIGVPVLVAFVCKSGRLFRKTPLLDAPDTRL